MIIYKCINVTITRQICFFTTCTYLRIILVFFKKKSKHKRFNLHVVDSLVFIFVFTLNGIALLLLLLLSTYFEKKERKRKNNEIKAGLTYKIVKNWRKLVISKKGIYVSYSVFYLNCHN
jgi:hypothetical protein